MVGRTGALKLSAPRRWGAFLAGHSASTIKRAQRIGRCPPAVRSGQPTRALHAALRAVPKLTRSEGEQRAGGHQKRRRVSLQLQVKRADAVKHPRRHGEARK